MLASQLRARPDASNQPNIEDFSDSACNTLARPVKTFTLINTLISHFIVVAKMMAQSKLDQAASPIVFPKIGSPYYVTGRKSLHATNAVGLGSVGKKVGFLSPEENGNNLEARNNENRTASISEKTAGVEMIQRSVGELSFKQDISNATLDLHDENSSEDEVQRTDPRFEDLQRGFEGDTEDSDNCSEWREKNGHATVDKSSSAPTCMRCKRRRIKRKSMSEDLGENRSRNVNEGRNNKRQFLQMPKQNLDMTSSRHQYASTDIKQAHRGPNETSYTASLELGFQIGSDTRKLHGQSMKESLYMTSSKNRLPETGIKQVHLQVPKRYADVCYVGDGLWDTDTTDVETDFTPQSSLDDSEGHLENVEQEKVKASDDVEL